VLTEPEELEALRELYLQRINRLLVSAGITLAPEQEECVLVNAEALRELLPEDVLATLPASFFRKLNFLQTELKRELGALVIETARRHFSSKETPFRLPA